METTEMRTAEHFVPGATSGNATSIDIAASPELVWEALHALTSDALKVTKLLTAVRSVPTAVRGRGSLLRSDQQSRGLLEALQASRFRELHSTPERLLTLGLVGQFWKLNGGKDAQLGSAEEFVAFAEPGFIKSAIDFAIEPTSSGARLTTNTLNCATDPEADRKFRRYWLLVGPFSKAIRVDMLRGVRRLAEAG